MEVGMLDEGNSNFVKRIMQLIGLNIEPTTP